MAAHCCPESREKRLSSLWRLVARRRKLSWKVSSRSRRKPGSTLHNSARVRVSRPAPTRRASASATWTPNEPVLETSAARDLASALAQPGLGGPGRSRPKIAAEPRRIQHEQREQYPPKQTSAGCHASLGSLPVPMSRAARSSRAIHSSFGGGRIGWLRQGEQVHRRLGVGDGASRAFSRVTTTVSRLRRRSATARRAGLDRGRSCR
jgi:hypothetical protein